MVGWFRYAVQMEIAQSAYMEEHSNNGYDEIRAAQLGNFLQTMILVLSRSIRLIQNGKTNEKNSPFYTSVTCYFIHWSF